MLEDRHAIHGVNDLVHTEPHKGVVAHIEVSVRADEAQIHRQLLSLSLQSSCDKGADCFIWSVVDPVPELQLLQVLVQAVVGKTRCPTRWQVATELLQGNS